MTARDLYRHWRALDIAALIAATGLTRFACRSHYLYDVDSVNFALALRRFDPAAYQPHPPGYFLYICLGRLANLLFHDANTALVAISIVFSCGAAAMIYTLARSWFDRQAALFAGLIFLFSPLAWFHGTVALTYIVEAFFSALLGYLCWRVSCGAIVFLLPAAAVAGIAAGFRPSSLLFLAPLFLFSLRGVKRSLAVGGIGVLALTVLAWFLPMIRMTGAQAYVSSLMSLWMAVPAKESIFNSSPMNSVARAAVIAGVYFLCFGCASLLPLCGVRGNHADRRRKAIFTWIWIVPGLLFFTFVFLKFVNSGYLLILTPPVCAWMGERGAAWYRNRGTGKARKILLIAAGAAVNVTIYICAPVYGSYGSVRRFETELTGVIAVVRQIAPSGETMIVGMDSHFLGYRHAGYYLPDYLTAQFPEVRLAAGRSVFAMRDRDTDVTQRLATGSIRNFVLFPLPSNEHEYSEYLALVRARFPAGDLHVVSRGGHEFMTGPVTDLHFLFPSCAPQTIATVH